jgi:hypothetical protein
LITALMNATAQEHFNNFKLLFDSWVYRIIFKLLVDSWVYRIIFKLIIDSWVYRIIFKLFNRFFGFTE